MSRQNKKYKINVTNKKKRNEKIYKRNENKKRNEKKK